jgi:hypothetical protein
MKTESQQEVKQPACKADHSSPSNPDIEKGWNYTSNPLYYFMTCTGTTLTVTYIGAALNNTFQSVT